MLVRGLVPPERPSHWIPVIAEMEGQMLFLRKVGFVSSDSFEYTWWDVIGRKWLFRLRLNSSRFLFLLSQLISFAHLNLGNDSECSFLCYSSCNQMGVPLVPNGNGH